MVRGCDRRRPDRLNEAFDASNSMIARLVLGFRQPALCAYFVGSIEPCFGERGKRGRLLLFASIRRQCVLLRRDAGLQVPQASYSSFV